MKQKTWGNASCWGMRGTTQRSTRVHWHGHWGRVPFSIPRSWVWGTGGVASESSGPILSHQTSQDAFLESRLQDENSSVSTVVPGHLQSQGPSALHCMQELILSSWEIHLIDIFSIVSPQSCRNPWRSIKIYVSHFGWEGSRICIKINESPSLGFPSLPSGSSVPSKTPKEERALGVHDSVLNFNNVLLENE